MKLPATLYRPYRPAEEALAAALANVKETSNYSLTDLGELVGVDRTMLWRFIRGRQTPSATLLTAIRYNVPLLAKEVDAVEEEARQLRLAEVNRRREAVHSA